MESINYRNIILNLFLVISISIPELVAQNIDQLFKTASGKLGTIKVIKGDLEENKFDLNIRVNWIDKDMKPISDENSLIVIEKNGLLISNPAMVKCITFNNLTFKTIQKEGKLSFLVDEKFTGGELNIDLKFGYASSIDEIENYKQFQFSQPSSLSVRLNIPIESIVFADKEAPEIIIEYPDFSKDWKQLINEKTIVIKGRIADRSEIRSFNLNGQSLNLGPDKNFMIPIKLVHGDNLLAFKAIDDKNNFSQKEFVIVHNDPEFSSIGIESKETEIEEKGKYYALIIGINDYKDYLISSLDKPISDATNFKNVLIKHYTFDEENIFLLKNPTLEEIIIALDNLNEKLSQADNLIIFYAGHGFWNAREELGYWLPSDSKRSNTANWLRNSTIRDYIKAIDAKHTLLIADACFSGGIFKTRNMNDAPKGVTRLYSMKSRQAMTSGTLEEVPDKSVFLQYLLKTLEENDAKYLATWQLFSSFKEAVMNNSNNVPQYGTIQGADDEGGDFIFIRRDK